MCEELVSSEYVLCVLSCSSFASSVIPTDSEIIPNSWVGPEMASS